MEPPVETSIDPVAQPRGGSWWRIGVRIAGALVIAVLCGLALRRLDWHALRDALAGARIGLIVAAAALVPIQLFCKAKRWSLMLEALKEVPAIRLFRYLAVAEAVGMVVPVLPVEVLRVYLLKRRDGVPVGPSVAVTAIEKLFEGASIMLVVAPLPFLLVLPRSVELGIMGLVAGGAVVVGSAVVLARRAEPARWSGRWARWASLTRGAACLRDPWSFARAVGWCYAARALDCVGLVLLFAAMNLAVPWAASALVVLAIAFAVLIPLTPGHVGTLEAAIVGALGIVGVPLAPAVACALVFHALRVVSVLLLGLTGVAYVADARAARRTSAVDLDR